MSDFYFISTGDKTKMYTLRLSTNRQVVINGDVRYMRVEEFVRNLSTDKATAENKAAYFANAAGIPLKGGASFSLEEIQRRKAGEVEAEREAKEQAERLKIEAEQAECDRMLADGVILMGIHEGKTPAEVVAEGELDYIKWLAKQAEANGKIGISGKIAEKWMKENVGTFRESEYVGTVGYVVPLTLKLQRKVVTEGIYGYQTMFVCTDEAGNHVNFYSTAKTFHAIEDGNVFKVEAEIRRHSVYAGEKRTLIVRPKLIK